MYVKPFNLAALKVGDFASKIILAPFILANENHIIWNAVLILSYFWPEVDICAL